MRKIKIMSKIFIILLLIFVGIQNVQAISLLTDDARLKIIQQENELSDGAGYVQRADGSDLALIVNIVIKTFLSLLGMIFIALMIYGGYTWMTAGGDEAKVTKAKSTIQKAIIGLVIIISSYAITWFVFSALDNGGGGGSGGGLIIE